MNTYCQVFETSPGPRSSGDAGSKRRRLPPITVREKAESPAAGGDVVGAAQASAPSEVVEQAMDTKANVKQVDTEEAPSGDETGVDGADVPLPPSQA